MKTDYSKIPLVFNVYKPSGPSSFQTVYQFKKHIGYDYGKIGHFGTLDPFAEGVLLIGVQGAQRLNELVHKLMPKTYRAIGVFGIKTSSGDLTSAVSEEKNIEETYQKLSKEDLEEFLGEHFIGEYWQSPHTISASKHEGKRLYKLAMAGKVIVKEKVKREIFNLVIHRFEYPYLDFSVEVSTGTYVRSMFEEMAELLGGVGSLKSLTRTSIGHLSIETALDKEKWPSSGGPFDIEKHGIRIDELLRLKKVFLTKDQSIRYAQGHRQLIESVKVESEFSETELNCLDYGFVYSHENDLIGLSKFDDLEIAAVFNLKLSLDKLIDQ